MALSGLFSLTGGLFLRFYSTIDLKIGIRFDQDFKTYPKLNRILPEQLLPSAFKRKLKHFDSVLKNRISNRFWTPLNSFLPRSSEIFVLLLKINRSDSN